MFRAAYIGTFRVGIMVIDRREAENVRFQRMLRELNGELVRLIEKFEPQLDDCMKADPGTSLPTLFAKEQTEVATFVLLAFPNRDHRRLSAREREVACLTVEGLSNDEIARRLGIKSSTVAAHVQKALGKLNLKTRTELAVNVLPLLGKTSLSSDRPDPRTSRS